jgi:hypothetical protein
MAKWKAPAAPTGRKSCCNGILSKGEFAMRRCGHYYVSVAGSWEVWFWNGGYWMLHGTDRQEGEGVHVFGPVPPPDDLADKEPKA